MTRVLVSPRIGILHRDDHQHATTYCCSMCFATQKASLGDGAKTENVDGVVQCRSAIGPSSDTAADLPKADQATNIER